MVLAKRGREDARIGLDIGGDGDVAALVQQIVEQRLGVAHGHAEPQIRIAAVEGGEERNRVIGGVGADPQMAALQGVGRAQDLDRLQLQAEHAEGDIQQVAADVSHLDPPFAAVEQADAEPFLQRPDLAGQGRLGHVQHLGGLGETALGRHRVEGAKLAVTYRCHLCIV